MHLLVLSAFRLWDDGADKLVWESQCTFWCSVLSDWGTKMIVIGERGCVSMHFLVLSAFRPQIREFEPPLVFPVSMHLLVLSAFRLVILQHVEPDINWSQCTFWCSVLSDSAPRKPRHNAVYRNEIAADLESTTSNRPAPVQLNHTTAKNRHKTTQRRRRPLPASTPPTFNEPKPKNRPLTTTPE